MRFVYNTFILDRAEYAKICREINTNYSKYEGKTYAVHILYGIDNKPYWYYFEFVSAMEHYAQKNAARLEMLTAYIKRNPGVKSADVIKFVSDQPDFADDAAYMRVC